MRQSVSALSTMEVKYMALTKAAKEAIWLKGLVNEMGLKQDSLKVKCDRQSAICFAKNARTKHIKVRYHHIRDWVNSGEIKVKKVHMDKNASDFLTKPVMTEKFKHC